MGRLAFEFRLALLMIIAPLSAPAQPGDFLHFESAHVHPIALSRAGDALYTVNTPDARLAIFRVQRDGSLVFVSDVPVGLEPVSLAVRPGASEVWVVNHLSDSVSIVDVRRRVVVETLRVGDEPTDVVFAGKRAFVSVSGKDDRVEVYDAATRAFVTSIEIPAEDPYAMTTTSGESVVAVVALRSGNGTTSLHQSLVAAGGGPPPPDPPRSPALPEPPDESLIVQFDRKTGAWNDESGGDWSEFIDIELPDLDLFLISADTPVPFLFGVVPALGTNLFEVASHPTRDELWVPNTDARNLVRFEPQLRGHLVETRVSIVSESRAVHVDLNSHIDYSVTPGPPAEIAQSLSQPGDGVFRSDGSRFYLTAFGSGRVAVLDGESGEVLERIPVGGGPSGIALHERLDHLYVMNRFDNTISMVSLAAGREVGVIGVAGAPRFDPSPEAIRSGRRLLYDAGGSSGHGDLSCGSCHIFGNWDGLAWDMGDPQGEFVSYADTPWVEFHPTESPHPGFHPMKGPMVTQTLRGLRGMEPFHWRGDRRDFQHFNGAFVSLLGRASPLSEVEMDAFADFIMTIGLPPNPNRALDDSLSEALPLPSFDRDGEMPTGNARHGEFIFSEVDTNPGGVSACADCHALPAGTVNKLNFAVLGAQDIKIAPLRTVYEKIGFRPFRTNGLRTSFGKREQTSGVGLNHAGSVSLNEFLVVFDLDSTELFDVAAFLTSFPTGVLPCVGQQVTLRARSPSEAVNRSQALLAEANSGRCDVIAKGRLRGTTMGFVYDPGAGQMVPDSETVQPVAPDRLVRRLLGQDALTYTAVPVGSGRRMGIDRDRDGCLDADEARKGPGPANPGLPPQPDSDDDGIPDAIDLCPGWRQSDPSQPDADGDGRPDACVCGDVDDDGLLDAADLSSLLHHLWGRSPEGFALHKCNVQGRGGDGTSRCDWQDFVALWRSLARHGSGAAEPPGDHCRPEDPAPVPTPTVCVDPQPTRL